MLAKYLLKYKKYILIYLLLNIFSVILLLNIYSIYGKIFSFGNSQLDYISCGVIFVIELFFLLVVVDAISYFQFKISFAASCLVKNDLFKSAMKARNGQIYISYIMNDMEIIEDDYYYNLLDLFSSFLQSAFFLFAILKEDIKYGIVVILLLLPTIFLQIHNVKVIPDTNKEVMESVEVELGFLINYFTSIIESKTNNLTDKFNEKLDKVFDEIAKTKMRHNRKMVFSSALLMFSIYLLKILSTIVFISEGFNLCINISSVVLLIGYTNNVANPIKAFLQTFIQLLSTKEIQNRINKALSSDMKQTKNKAKIFEMSNFSMNGINVVINDKSIIDDLRYTFNMGVHYAIIGDNGSGKSTLFKTIVGLIEYSGDIRFDNKTIDLETIRKNIGYLPQNCNLINSTIRNNITMFDQTITDKKIIEVIKLLNLDKVLEGEGINRNISDARITLSSGEKKRICLARLLCRDYKVLLIDEGTSALDKSNTELIEDVLKRQKDRIIISIIHKPEYLKYYDVILKLNNGQLEEMKYE